MFLPCFDCFVCGVVYCATDHFDHSLKLLLYLFCVISYFTFSFAVITSVENARNQDLMPDILDVPGSDTNKVPITLLACQAAGITKNQYCRYQRTFVILFYSVLFNFTFIFKFRKMFRTRSPALILMKNLCVGTFVKDSQHCRVAFKVSFFTRISKFCLWAMAMYYKVNISSSK